MSMFMMRLQPSLPDDVLRRHFCVLSAMPMTVFGHGCCYTHTQVYVCVLALEASHTNELPPRPGPGLLWDQTDLRDEEQGRG